MIAPYFQIDYTTPEYSAFSIGAGLTGYTHFGKGSERKDRLEDFDKFILHQLYLKYDISQTSLKMGRQELEEAVFLSDYYEALSLVSRDIENVSLLLAVVEKVAESDISKFIKFQNINRGNKSINDLLYVAETTWDIVPEAISTTFFYYKLGNLYDLYGTYVDLSHETEDVTIGLRADAYATNEHSVNGMRDANAELKDSDIFHIKPFVKIKDIMLAFGYIKADRDIGAREGGLIDDYFNPLNEGDKVYKPDARTWYGGLKYETDNINAKLVFGRTDYLHDEQFSTEEEFDINVTLNFPYNCKLKTEFANVNTKSPEGDYKIFQMSLSYGF